MKNTNTTFAFPLAVTRAPRAYLDNPCAEVVHRHTRIMEFALSEPTVADFLNSLGFICRGHDNGFSIRNDGKVFVRVAGKEYECRPDGYGVVN